VTHCGTRLLRLAVSSVLWYYAVCRVVGIKKAAWKRLDLVVALNPNPQHLPALSSIVVGSQPKFLQRLEQVRQGQFKSRGCIPNSGIRVRHPCLWRQL
jgi:hypothetical protein